MLRDKASVECLATSASGLALCVGGSSKDPPRHGEEDSCDQRTANKREPYARNAIP